MKKKSTPQTSQHSWKYAILLSLTAIALLASPRSGADPENCVCLRYWDNSGTGDWFDASNWGPNHDSLPSCLSQVCGGVMGQVGADINNGGTAQISGLTTTARACETFLARNPSQSGYLYVDHGDFEMCHELHVGYQGKGTLSIKNGGLVTTLVGADIAAIADSHGTVNVDGTYSDGTKSTWTINGNGGLFVGGQPNLAGGAGLLSVTNHGMVNATSAYVYASGTMTGNGTVTTTSGTTTEGTIAPSNGTLTIVGGLTFSGHAATMECNVVPASADNVSVIGAASLGTGSRISVTMTGSTFTAGSTYTLLQSSGVLSGAFQFPSIKGGSGDCFTPEITYDYPNNKVKLYLAPCN